MRHSRGEISPQCDRCEPTGPQQVNPHCCSEPIRGADRQNIHRSWACSESKWRKSAETSATKNGWMHERFLATNLGSALGDAGNGCKSPTTYRICGMSPVASTSKLYRKNRVSNIQQQKSFEKAVSFPRARATTRMLKQTHWETKKAWAMLAGVRKSRIQKKQ